MKSNYDIIEKYLKDEMTPEEREQFVYDIKRKPMLREKSMLLSILIKKIRDRHQRQVKS